MTDELFSLRVIVVSGSPGDHDLFRQAASASKVPIEIIEADGAASACRSLAAGVDLAFLDAALGSEEIAQLIAAARAAAKPPFTVLMAGPGTPPRRSRPTPWRRSPRMSKRLSGSWRDRFESGCRVACWWWMISATMRGIVRKILAATRFPLEVSEVEQGSEAIELARKIDFDIVFLDYNMPGFSGLETMAEFRREKRNPTFVLITSTQDEAVADARARAGRRLSQEAVLSRRHRSACCAASMDCARSIRSVLECCVIPGRGRKPAGPESITTKSGYPVGDWPRAFRGFRPNKLNIEAILKRHSTRLPALCPLGNSHLGRPALRSASGH